MSEAEDLENYGINIEHAHERARQLIPEDFFWSAVDELAPFGSDEGDVALAEYRGWRLENPGTPTIECLQWVIESVGEMNFEDYNESLVDREWIKQSIEDPEVDDFQYLYTLDLSVIATGFAQLVDEGVIEPGNKPLIKIAIDRMIIWSELHEDWEHRQMLIDYLRILERALREA